VDQPAGRRRPAGALGHRRRSGAPAAGAPPAQRRRAPAGHRLPLLSSPVHRGGAGAARHPAAAAGSASNASSGASASAKRCWPDDPFLAARAAQQAAAAAATARGPPSSALCASPSMSDENALLEAVVGPGCALHAADSGAWDLAFQDACCPLPGPGAGDMHGDGGAWEAAHCAAPHHPLSPGSEADDDCLPQEELGGIMADALAGAQGCDGAAGGAGAGGRMVHGLGSLAALDSLLTQEQQQEQEWALAGDIFGCAVAPRGAPASAGSGGGPLGRGGLFGSPVKAPPALSLSPSPGPGLGGAAAAAAGLDGSTPPEAGEAVQAAARKLQLPSVVGHDSDSDGPCTTGLQLSAFWAPPEAGRRDSADGVAGGGAALRTTGSLDSSHLVTLADLGGAAAPAVVAGSGPVAAGAGRLVDVGKLEVGPCAALPDRPGTCERGRVGARALGGRGGFVCLQPLKLSRPPARALLPHPLCSNPPPWTRATSAARLTCGLSISPYSHPHPAPQAPELRSLLASTMQEVAALREQLAGSQQEAEQWRAQAQRQEAAVSGIRRQVCAATGAACGGSGRGVCVWERVEQAACGVLAEQGAGAVCRQLPDADGVRAQGGARHPVSTWTQVLTPTPPPSLAAVHWSPGQRCGPLRPRCPAATPAQAGRPGGRCRVPGGPTAGCWWRGAGGGRGDGGRDGCGEAAAAAPGAGACWCRCSHPRLSPAAAAGCAA
jgi:hypothetical protein